MLNGKPEYPTPKELTEALGGEWNAHCRTGKCLCPAHADTDPSLDITEKGGRTLIICRAGCSQDAVFDELRGRGHWPERKRKANGANGHAGQPKTIVATYSYQLRDGREHFQVVRFAPKDFRPRRSDGRGGWKWTLPKTDRCLPYRLPELHEALALQRPVFIVEGEKDVDSLAKLGIAATCNAGGAGKWKAAHAAHLKGGDLVIIPDNDAAGQKHAESVAASLVGIAKRVRILNLPDLPPKGDVSDWLVAGGAAEQLWTLAEQAPEWKVPTGEETETQTDPDLVELNAKFAVVRIGGKTRIVFMEESFSYPGCKVPVYSSLPDFRAFHDKRRKAVEVDGEQKQIGLGTWWIRNEQRQQYDGIVYMPTNDSTLTVGKLNLWTGYGCVPREGDCDAYLKHLLDNVCCGAMEHYEYLVNWMAYAVQHPGRPGEVAVVMRGNEGTGKGITAKQFGRLLGSHFRHITQAGHLTGHFNAHLQHCSVLFADEAFFAGDRSHESILKALITEETLMIEPKGVDPFPVRNCLHLIMSSNSSWVVPVSHDARRYFVLSVSDAKKHNHDYFATIISALDNGGREALLHFLLNRDLSTFNIRNVPQTSGLADQKAHSRRGVDRLIEHLAHDGVLIAVEGTHPDVAITSGEERNEGFYARAKALVPDLKHQSSIVISRMLKDEWECKAWKSSTLRGIAFPALGRLRELFERKHGQQEWSSDVKEWGDG